MKYLKFSFCVCFFITSFISAQTKKITLEDIWENNTFALEYMDALHSMANGQQYSVLNFDRVYRSTSIDVYDYKTLQKVSTIVNSKDLDAIPYFIDYTFSEDEQNIILTADEESIYRRSSKGHYYVYNRGAKTLNLISEDKIQEPTFSPDGKKVAFVKDNNIYVKDLASEAIKQITFDGKKNEIINGITDWVYEEEFKFVRAFDWNANNDKIAFIRFDETMVPEFSMDIYGTGLYQTQQVFKYPKAGESNAVVSLYVYDLETNISKEMKTSKIYEDFYIPRMEWTNESDVLSAQFMNRYQNELDLWMFDTNADSATLVLEEKDKAYVEVTDYLTFLDDNSFIWTSEKDGYNHVYHYDKAGELINQVTKGNWEVTDYYGFDEKNKTIFYQSVENGSINRDVYAVKINGRNKLRLTKQDGTNEADFSADFSFFINAYSSATIPIRYTLHGSKSGKLIKVIKNNDAVAQKLSEYQISKKEFSTIQVNGNDLNIWTIKPADFDETKKYPLLMFQYSGAGRQKVVNSWNDSNDYWFQYLASKGFIIVCSDGRGTPFRGAEFKKSIYGQLGKLETEDQITLAKELGKKIFIDETRIGIWGWSYGGFVSSNCLFQGSDVFKMAIAVAPVTNWRFYDSVYTERFLGIPQENPKGYDENSPINHVAKLKGEYLLIHGSADDNVHVQNTMRLVEALVQADKDFEWAIYPDKNHGIYGGNTRLHLFKKMTKFIDETLGEESEDLTNNKKN